MDLSKYYEPAGVESKWYAHWTANHYFNSFPMIGRLLRLSYHPPM